MRCDASEGSSEASYGKLKLEPCPSPARESLARALDVSGHDGIVCTDHYLISRSAEVCLDEKDAGVGKEGSFSALSSNRHRENCHQSQQEPKQYGRLLPMRGERDTAIHSRMKLDYNQSLCSCHFKKSTCFRGCCPGFAPCKLDPLATQHHVQKS